MMHAWLETVSGLPALMRAGLMIFLVGAAGDVLYHAAPAQWISMLDLVVGRDGSYAHIVTMVGMVFIVLGLIYTAVRRSNNAARP